MSSGVNSSSFSAFHCTIATTTLEGRNKREGEMGRGGDSLFPMTAELMGNREFYPLYPLHNPLPNIPL